MHRRIMYQWCLFLSYSTQRIFPFNHLKSLIMKLFIIANWYRLTTASAMLIFALAFLIFVLKNNVAIAGIPANKQNEKQLENVWIVAKGNGIYEVTWDKFNSYKCKMICDGSGR